MNLKHVAASAPLLLCLVSGAARADLEPFSFGASESIAHDGNLNRTDDASRLPAWYSTTELHAAMDQAIGRDRLTAKAGVNYNAYRDVPDRNAFGYQGAVGLDWSTVGDLSGSLGADASRHQYLYGFSDALGPQVEKNLETDDHAYAKVSLGGPSRWNIFGGFDASRRRYSAELYAANAEQQWSQSFGTTYSTSPDLSFGVTGSYTRGEYPDYSAGASKFHSKTLSATTNWQASGNSSVKANLGYTTQDSDLQPALRFVSGALNWRWKPPSHFTVDFGVSRGTDGGVTSGANPSQLNDRSLNTSANLDVSYALTAKINLVASGQYARRKYAGVTVPIVNADGSVFSSETVSGVNHTSRFALYAHYQPTRTTDLSCGASREIRGSGSAALTTVSPNYADNIVQCSASIRFD